VAEWVARQLVVLADWPEVVFGHFVEQLKHRCQGNSLGISKGCGKYYDYLYVDIHPANSFVRISRKFSLFYLPAKISLFRRSHATPAPFISGICLIAIYFAVPPMVRQYHFGFILVNIKLRLLLLLTGHHFHKVQVD
jgi:hypothetical protein